MPATSIEAKKRKQQNAYLRLKDRIANDPEFRLAYNRARTSRRKTNNPQKFFWKKIQSSARSRNIEFTIQPEDLVIPTHCPVFGVLLEEGHPEYAPSVDRIDNNKGYVKGNVWIISRRANRIKNDSTLEELQLLVTALQKI
jgi:hypothetical protein